MLVFLASRRRQVIGSRLGVTQLVLEKRERLRRQAEDPFHALLARKILREHGEPPREGKWADIAVLEPVRDYKARHASTLLTFDAVVDAIGQIEKKRAGGEAAPKAAAE